jgi:hypothetical protein
LGVGSWKLEERRWKRDGRGEEEGKTKYIDTDADETVVADVPKWGLAF